MIFATKLVIIGLTFNTLASLLMLYPYFNIKRDIDEDFIVDFDRKNSKFTQRKHLKDRKLGVVGFSLFALGFILQIIGIAIG